MDTVYLFFENENIRIPFYDYDKGLFSQLIKSRMGHWENDDRQYHISRSSYDSDQLKIMLDGRPFVEVDKEPDNPVIVHGFISGGQSEPEETASAVPETCSSLDVTAGDLPDQFPDHLREKMETEMHSRMYSRCTRTAYINSNKALCKWLQKPPEDVSSDDIKRYLAYLEYTKQQAASTLNSALSAFKFFYNEVLKKNTAQDQRRPRQDRRLPIVLSKAEIKKMIDGECNTKHRLLLMMVYASGLRVSEVVKLRRKDVDVGRKAIMIVSGKGRKDRYTIISDTVMETLTLYYKQYNVTNWLFTGVDPASHLSIRSAQYICKNAIKKAHIEKAASIHSLRHSFATHLLEGGTDICHIRDLLGHTSVRTTERYTHVARRRTLKVTSPLDTIDQYDDDED